MANPNPSPKTRFKAGDINNPRGKTSAQRKLEIENAERATRIRARMLKAFERVVGNSDDVTDEELDNIMKNIGSDSLRLIKDSEDRGLGAPKQEHTLDASDPLKAFFEEIRNSGKRIGAQEGN